MYRDAEPEELRDYAYKLQGIVEGSPNWGNRYDPESALAALASGKLKAAIINECYLLLYAVASPWYNENLVDLYELGIYRVERGEGGIGAFQDIDKALIDIANQWSATRIIVGTSLPKNKEALARLYRRQGYKDHAIALFKENH